MVGITSLHSVSGVLLSVTKLLAIKNGLDKGETEQFGRQRRGFGALNIRKIYALAGIQQLVGHKLHGFRIGRHFGVYADDGVACLDHNASFKNKNNKRSGKMVLKSGKSTILVLTDSAIVGFFKQAVVDQVGAHDEGHGNQQELGVPIGLHLFGK